MIEEFVQVGKLKKTFGNNGDISFRLFSENDVILGKDLPIFLYLDGIYVPFFIVSYDNGKKSVLHLEDIDTLKEAEDIAGKAIYIEKKHIENDINPKDQLEFGYLKGYLLKDHENSEVGYINDIVSYPMQEMAIVKNNVLIPLNERLIIEIDTVKKILKYQIIDGLLD